jgi:hypothetical protein
MVKADECELLAYLLRATGGQPFVAGKARGAEDALSMHPKRLDSILEKWSNRGRWDYGVSAISGWFTPEFCDEINKATSPQTSPE